MVGARLAVLAVVVAVTSAACGTDDATDRDRVWNNGRLSIATGNTTGVYYQLGGAYADIITKHVPGYEATAEATGASVENIQRVVRGDADIAFTLADTANDAVRGEGSFDTPQAIRAIARIYANYTHAIVRGDAQITSVAGMRGKRVSTGSPNSGTEVIALRMLRAAGLDPAKDIVRHSLSLPDTVAAMKAGVLDALFWSGGLPTGGITDLVTSLRTGVVFLNLGDLLPTLRKLYGTVYQAAVLPETVYKTPTKVPTISVPNLIVVSDRLPAALAYDLTRVLFEHQPELAEAHAEGKNISVDTGPQTEPVPLSAGAQRYYRR